MKFVHVCMVILAAGMVIAGCGKDGDTVDDRLNDVDMNFVPLAAIGNYGEVLAGQLAVDSGDDASIVDFGRMMVREHSAAGAELKAMAASIALRAPDSLDAEHTTLMTTLMTLDGREFDSTYIHSQVRDHQQAIALYEMEANRGRRKQVRDFALKMLPRLKMHLHHADSLAQNY